jgi:hypothetical protein
MRMEDIRALTSKHAREAGHGGRAGEAERKRPNRSHGHVQLARVLRQWRSRRDGIEQQRWPPSRPIERFDQHEERALGAAESLAIGVEEDRSGHG